MTPNTLLCLPAELLPNIASQLGIGDLSNFRLSCSWVASSTFHLVFNTLCINLRDDIISRNLEKLRAIANGTQPAAIDRTVNLVVTSLVLHWHNIGRRYSMAFVKGLPLEPAASYDSEVEETMSLLWMVLPMLVNVTDVRWETFPTETESTRQQFSNILLQYPNLRRLSFADHDRPETFFSPWDPAPAVLSYLKYFDIRQLHNLQHLKIHTPIEISSLLPTILRQSLGLTSLEISTSHQMCQSELRDSLANVPTLNLRHFSITNCRNFELIPPVMVHIENLQSLSLHHLDYPFLQWGAYNEPNPGPTRMWTSLMEAGIRLKELAVDAVPEKLIEYLKSYSGLRKLNVIGPSFEWDYEENVELARRIWTDVLAKHASTLRELSITSSKWEDVWKYEKQRRGALIKCTRLRKLELSVSEGKAGGVGSMDDDRDIFRLAMKVINDVATDFPRVQTLRLRFGLRTPAAFEKLVGHFEDNVSPPRAFGRLKYLSLNYPRACLRLRETTDKGGKPAVQWRECPDYGEEEWRVADI